MPFGLIDQREPKVDISVALGIMIGKSEMISFVGGGGKTTTMFTLARELKLKGAAVLVTTTTNIFYPESGQCDRVIMDSSPTLDMFGEVQPGTVVCLGGGVFGELNKVKSIDSDFLDKLFAAGIFDYILVEADGAKRKPIKASAEYEPVIPGLTTAVVGVIGMDALDMPAEDKYVHRVDIFCEITGVSPGEIIDEKAIVNLIEHCDGLFKHTPVNSAKIVLLNKADTEVFRSRSALIACLVNADAGVLTVIVASMHLAKIYTIFNSGPGS